MKAATLAQLGLEIMPRLQSAGNTVGKKKNTASESGGSSNVTLHVRHVTGTGSGLLGEIPRVVVQKSALL